MILAQSIAIGLVLGFVLFELTGLVAGGLVTPGYFALYFDQPLVMAQTVAVAVCAMLLTRILSMFLILYGRRRFTVTILLAFFLQWSASSLFWGLAVAETRVDALGYVIPGILANEMERQGLGKTLAALLILTCCVRVLLVVFGLVR
jgi:poly-gamma-glutamate biosynthesis protein PgsC/CapC